MSAGRKLLVANRSEIATRVFRSATELGLRTVAIYAQEDRFGVHRFKADEAYLVGRGRGPVAAYLDIEGIVALAKSKGVDLIHPGYGFLSENAAFARACAAAGLTFVGPRPELLDLMGDKTAARRLAQKLAVPVLPGTEEPVTDPAEALRRAKEIGFPLIIKAAFGGGGRGMRVVHQAADLKARLEEAQGEAATAFGNPAVFLEKFVSRAKHIEVQVLGDRHGNAIHLHERDCSVQRRHQKVIEIAPSVDLPADVRAALCDASVRLAREIRYDNAGTMEFLVNADDPREWYFIEMNPRIQVEHTVTEVITGLDLVRAQILIAQGHALHSPEVGMPAQADVPRRGYAVQCRVTTEDPANKFTPDYGKILNYRNAAGLGIRLDEGMGDTGSVITPFYDSLLVKITASAPTFDLALARMGRALSEFRIRGVKTNIPFLENVITHPVFKSGAATTGLIDSTPALFEFKARRDRASKLLAFLGDVTVNGNPQLKGRRPTKVPPAPTAPAVDLALPVPAGSRDRLKQLGPEKFARWVRAQKALLVTDTTLRDAHQSLMAARLRTHDMLAVADAVARRTPGLFSLECWGGATFDTSMRFLHEDPYARLAQLRARIPNICFQMLLRGANAVGYSFYPDNVVTGFVRHAADAGVDIFRVFDSLNYVPNLKVAMKAVRQTDAICEAAICYTGDLLDPRREKYSLKYYVKLARELESLGAHMIAIKDMAGLCRPYAATRLIRALRDEIGLPIHFHTHDTSGIASASIIAAADAGVDVVDLALASMSGSTSQPNLNSIVAALAHTPRATGLDLDALNDFSGYWEQVRELYAPFDSSPRTGSAEVYLHEMPGGQYTNLREQAEALGLGARWPEVVRTYAEVNLLFGDIVKVTPSSKVVGDLTLFLVSRGIKPADVPNLEPGTAFPASVVDMLAGGLGQPPGGWPKKLQRVVLGDRQPLKGRPGANLPPVNLAKEKEALHAKLKREVTDGDLYCHLMYPEVFADYARFERTYGDVSVVPSNAFLYGLRLGEEITVAIEEGKTLFVKLTGASEADKDGYRTLTFELNGRPRETRILDTSVQVVTKARAKADPADSGQIGAPIPGLITMLAVSVGTKVAKGDKLVTLEAMKMQTTVYATTDGIVSELLIAAGDTVEAKDLLLRIRPAS
ncbi:MAG: pyruvate carboxylase [Opitutaceae bacterium]|nr:pyruvate carboxylase [Opitutaceae bacterium]